uniref:Anoctamin transmembrane domain-containing protein n=1 Tax=Hyaloperonospora arabidopsidis (strain Emoy2) TaxID=559515 RepID=M4B6R4_HYAAE
MDVILCFDTDAYSQAAVDFFVQMVEKQSHLIIAPKSKNVLEKQEAKEGEIGASGLKETYYLLGATHTTLMAIKEKKERALYGEVSDEPVPERFCSGDRIDLVMFELERLKVRLDYWCPTGDRAVEIVDDKSVAEIPEPWQDEEHGRLLQQAMHSKLLTDHFPLHDNKERSELVDKWVKKWMKPQPVNTVRSYFGEEVGFYFAFLGMYTQWLMPLAAIGLLTFVLDFFPSWSVYGRGLYSLLVTSWATAFLKFWKRRESTMRNEWGISASDSMALELTRTEFFGEKRYDPAGTACTNTFFLCLRSRTRS